MIVYVVATLLACFAAWMAGRDQARRRMWIVASALPLTLVAAARWGVGTDLDFTYLPTFTAVEWVRGGGADDDRIQIRLCGSDGCGGKYI